MPEGTMPLTGAITLEIFRLAVDPIAKQLIPVTGLPKINAGRLCCMNPEQAAVTPR